MVIPTALLADAGTVLEPGADRDNIVEHGVEEEAAALAEAVAAEAEAAAEAAASAALAEAAEDAPVIEQAAAEAAAAELSDAEEMALDSFSEQNEEETVVATTNPLADAVTEAVDANLIQGEDIEEEYDAAALDQLAEDAEQGEDETEAEDDFEVDDEVEDTSDDFIG